MLFILYVMILNKLCNVPLDIIKIASAWGF